MVLGNCEMDDSNMSPNGKGPADEASGGYGQKGDWKKWLLIYVIVAVVVYGAYYLLKARY